MMGKIN